METIPFIEFFKLASFALLGQCPKFRFTKPLKTLKGGNAPDGA